VDSETQTSSLSSIAANDGHHDLVLHTQALPPTAAKNKEHERFTHAAMADLSWPSRALTSSVASPASHLTSATTAGTP
jgi:hypothetical protein